MKKDGKDSKKDGKDAAGAKDVKDNKSPLKKDDNSKSLPKLDPK